MWDSLEQWFSRAEAWLTDVLQQSSDEHVAIKLLALSAALLPVIVASGVLYKAVSGVPITTAFYKMYCLLYRIELGKEPNILSYLVTNGVFILGFFTLALLLGVVNDEVQRRADDARMGRNPVNTKDHVLLLNWNQNSPALLRNIATAISTAATAPAAPGGKAAAGANPWARDPTVVVLADIDKSVMDASVQEAVRDRGLHLNVHTREGSPFKPSHLRKVSAPRASVVILLHPDNASSPADAEAMKAAAAMSLSTLQPASSTKHSSGQHQQQRMIVQMPSSVPAGGNVLKSLLLQTSAVDGSGSNTSEAGAPQLQLQVLAMPDDTLTNRMVAQTAAQPGVLTCWQEIMAPAAGSSQFSCLALPRELQQQPYINIRRAFRHAVVCGFIDGGGKVHLNPDESVVPGPDSKIIQLTPWGGVAPDPEVASQLYVPAAEAAAQRLRWGTTYKSKARTIVVAAWPEADVPELMRSFSEFNPFGSTVTFISQHPPDPAWLPRRGSGSSKFTFLTHPYPTSTEALVQAGISAADTVVLGTGEGQPSDAEADARVLAALLQVQEAVLSCHLPAAPHVVAPIREHGTSTMALQYLQDLASRVGKPSPGAAAAARSWALRRGATAVANGDSAAVVRPEFLVFRDVTSAVLAQVVYEHAYADIITELLFSCEGQEMYLRSPASFNIPLGVPITFAEVSELARITHQTALGCIHVANNDQPGSSNIKGTALAAAGEAAHARQPSTAKLSTAVDVRLGLSASDTVVFNEGDFVVVLADDFVV